MSIDDQILVLHHLVEGTSIRSTSRVTGINQRTVLKLLVKFGNACRDFLDGRLRGLELRHIQCDEQWTFVQKKQGKLHDEELDNPGIGDQYLWIAFDTDSKVMATYAIGKRSADNARRFMVDLASRIALPTPTDTGERAGITHRSARTHSRRTRKPLTSRSGRTAGTARSSRITATPTSRAGTLLLKWSGRNAGRYSAMSNSTRYASRTSHVERQNLTTRTLMKRFTRLSVLQQEA